MEDNKKLDNPSWSKYTETVEYMNMKTIFDKFDFSEVEKKAMVKFRDMVWYGSYAENEKGERVNPITFEKE